MKYSIKDAASHLGVTTQTLREWERKGKIKCERTPGGHRRYDENELIRLSGRKVIKERVTAIYVRVSTPSRKDDLERQKEVLLLYCAAKGWENIIIEDIGSGLNCNKKGLLELIELIETNRIARLVLNYQDRLLRFGNEIIFEMCKFHDVEVVIVTETEAKTYEEELVEDALSVITVFSAKLYGSRSHKNQKVIEENKKLFKKKV